MTVCPFDPDLPADECCGTTRTDCCDGLKADCATAANEDVCVCANGYGCNVYGDNVTPEDEDQATLDEWTRANEAEVLGDGFGDHHG